MDYNDVEKLKVVITGGQRTGKTTFIQTICERWDSNPSVPDLVMDFGRLVIDDRLTVYLFGTPYGQHTGFMNAIIDELLCVVMVNSAHPETFDEARQTINIIEHYSTMSYVVAANFQDIEDAWFPEDLRIALRIPSHVPIVPCAAWHVESVTDVLLTLFEMVLDKMNQGNTTGAGV